MFVSHAQNYEDVMLWRALRDVEAGFYIDAGASFPDTDSVTRAFYDRGWSGLNVEPAEAPFARLLVDRPRDVNLNVALGDTSGEMVFHEVEGEHTGLSSLAPEAMAQIAANGFPVRPRTIRVRTLAELCRALVRQPIHFLKIDVEGAEAAVLAGADFSAYRPWIVLVEATAPMSSAPTHAAWEPLLLGFGYRFAWFDGLNRFYLSAEHADALARHFEAPPNVFDGFVRAGEAAAVASVQGMACALDGHKRQALQDRESAIRHAAQAESARQHLLRTEAEAAQARARADAAEAAVLAMRSSASWRLTAPMRRVARAVRDRT